VARADTVDAMTDPTSLPDFPPPPGERPLRGRVLDVLIDEGYRPDIDEDGDVAVKVQGQQLYVRSTEGDITVLRVFGQWRLDDTAADELSLLRACNAVTRRLSVAKATLGDGVLVVSADHVVTAGTPFEVVLTSSLELVLTAVAMWHDVLGGAAGGTDGPQTADG
jgi:hypothetical protein